MGMGRQGEAQNRVWCQKLAWWGPLKGPGEQEEDGRSGEGALKLTLERVTCEMSQGGLSSRQLTMEIWSSAKRMGLPDHDIYPNDLQQASPIAGDTHNLTEDLSVFSESLLQMLPQGYIA